MKKKFDNYFDEAPKLTLLVMCFIIFMFTYGLVFNKMTFNHDSIARTFSGLWYQANGRFLREPITDLFAFATYNPIINSFYLFASFYMSTLLQVKLFNIKSNFVKVLIFAANVTYPIFAIYWGYDNDMWEYILAYTLINAALYTTLKAKYKYKDFVACLFVIGALAIYQSVISPLVSIWAAYWIALTFKEELDWKPILLSFGKLVLFVIAYYIVNLYIEFVLQVERNTYMNGDEIGLKFLISNIPHSIVMSYQNFYQFMTNKLDYFANPFIHGFSNAIIILSLIVSPIILKVKGMSKKNTLISALIIFVMPILINAVYFITQIDLIRIQFGFIAIYLLAIVLFVEYEVVKYKVNLLIIPLLFILLVNYQNTTQLLNILIEKNELDLYHANTIYKDLSSNTDYDISDEVVFCGSMRDNENYPNHSWYPYFMGNYSEAFAPGVTVGVYNGLPDMEVDYSYHFTYLFMRIGQYVNVADGDCDFKQAYYPETGYIEEKEDVWYIRLGASEKLGY